MGVLGCNETVYNIKIYYKILFEILKILIEIQ